MSRGLRLVVYDRTCRGRRGHFLSEAWWTGARLHRLFGSMDAAHGAASWREALDFLATVRPSTRIGEIQFWGHGKWGDARVADHVLDERALTRQSALRTRLSAVRDRLTPDALFWFRTCETLGADRGQRFARAFADRMGARVAGHTYVIGLWQSGLHVLRPGHVPGWDPEEGLAEGRAADPVRALMSLPTEPNTITCFTGAVPSAIALTDLGLSVRSIADPSIPPAR